MTTENSIHARIKWLLIAGSMLVAVAAGLLVWVPYQRQMRLIEDIESMRRNDLFWVRPTDPEVVIGIQPWRQMVGVETERFGPEWLHKLVGYDRMRGIDTLISVSLNGAPIDDAWLKRLARLSSLEILRLDDTQISDNGLKHLAGLSSLQVLFLNTEISDDNLKHLAGLSSLTELSLTGTQIGDEGLKHLDGLTSLIWLRLDGTQISDDGLKHLAKLPSLRILILPENRVSDDGMKKLRQALPHCKMWQNPSP